MFLRTNNLFDKKNLTIKPENKGSVLIYLLFIIAVISYMVLDFSQNSRIRLQLAGNYYVKTQKKLDLSNLAILLSIKYYEQDMNFIKDEESDSIKKQIEYKGNKYFIEMVKESDLVNLNGKDDNLIRNIIKEKLEDLSDPETLESITDAILDWKDSDNDTRMHGAEHEDYDNKFFPYNKNFESLIELKLVKGIGDSELFFQEKKDDEENLNYAGLFTLFTVWKNSARIFSLKDNKEVNYKNILRIYVKTGNNFVYVYFTGKHKNKIRVFKRIRLM